MPRAGAAVGLDVGGTFTKLAAVTRAGRILLEAQMPAEVERGPRALVERVAALLAAWKKEKGLRISALGMGLAGDVDSEKGLLRFAPNLRGWDGFNFKQAFARRLGLRAVVDNDANAAVWGAYVVELKRKPKTVVGITLGTGVGGGVIIGGKLYRGATGSAGEVGHTRVAGEDGAPCHCGSRGCLEAYAGSYGIVRTARDLLEAEQEGGRVLREICPDLALLEPRHLTEAAERGDAVARAAWKATGRSLGLGLANLVLALNPEVLLILGGVSRAGRWITEPIREVLDAQPFRTAFSKAQLRLTASPNAGSIGAALLAWEEQD